MSILSSKLQIKNGMQGEIYHLPVDLEDEFADLVRVEEDQLDYAVVFVSDQAALKASAQTVVAQLKTDGLLWFCYPKKSSGAATDITRDTGWSVLEDMGYRPVRQIAVDSTWSALRFRLKSFVGR